MLGYTPLSSPVTLTTDRMVLRQADQRDAWRIADYYAQNQEFLRSWEPRRDHSYFQHGGWQARLHLMVAQQRQGSACYFLLMDPQAQGVWGVANFTQIVKGCFYACYLVYSLAEKQQGQGLMYEGLQSAIRYIQRRHKMHRIMANYLPRNHRSGNLRARLGFEKEGYAKDYLLINGRWEDHILTALIRREAELSSGL